MTMTLTQPDVTLLLDMDGVIRDVTLSTHMSGESADNWLGRRWDETVVDVGGDKIKRMIEDARTKGISAFRQVTQRFPSGVEVPMEYTTVLLGGHAGLLAIGKNLQAVAELQSRLVAAQQTMERDYWKLRDIETRYRVLFDASNEAVVLIRAANLRLVEANPAATEALGLTARDQGSAAGRDFLAEVVEKDRELFQAMLQRVREQGKAPAILVHLGPAAKPWVMRASLMTSDPGPVFMLQFAPAGTAQSMSVRNSDSVSIEDMLERVPDGFVVLNADGVIRRANQAFLELVQVGSKSAVLGERLGRWLSRPGADLSVLLANVQRHRTVRLLSTTIRGELGTDTEVEISAAGNTDTDPEHIAVILRNVTRRLQPSDEAARLRSALSPIAEQIGKTSLRQLVRRTVDVVEKYYVKAALELADDNRTAAAQLLGVSRQSLYAKLNRYNLDGASALPPSGDH